MKYIRIAFAILMLACLVYSVSIYMVGSGTLSFVIWLAGAAFWGVAFFLAGKDRWTKAPAPVRTGCYILIALMFIAVISCCVAMASHFGDKGDDNLDYIVVLGAQMREHGPSVIFKYRLDAAYEYLSENPDTVCIISGGRGVNESVSEGEGGKDYLISRGIDPARLIAETNAMDTSENISFSLDMMDRDRVNSGVLKIGIVTNNYHLFRGIHLAKGLTGNEIYGIAGYTVPWYLPNNMVRECLGILRDFTKMGW